MHEQGSPFLKLVSEIYQEVYGEVEEKAIHAGLECGLFKMVNPELQIVSLGPDIKNAHSPDERVNIATVNQIYTMIKKIMNRIGELE